MADPIIDHLRNPTSRLNLKATPRGRAAIEGIVADALIDGRGLSAKELEDVLTADLPLDNSFIENLWNDPKNKPFVEKFMNNELCKRCAEGDPVSLEAYKVYAVQDYFYLVDYVKFKALRLATVLQYDLNALKTELQSVSHTYGDAEGWKKTCIDDLGIDSAVFNTAERSVAELAYANFLQNNCRMEDWFNLHVIVIACIYGWSVLSLKLYNDPKTDKTTQFYKTFIEGNLDLSDPENPQLARSARTLSAFLTANSQRWTSIIDDKEQYGLLFRTSLRLEVALFNSGYEKV
ncbi:hypothetical protein C8Q70DRAFT_1059043 [Cubamyces menziesii]|uniref:Thiaminase-2/PQQC domain-containing protein n=1 Tax=Trametes cubensis TaxID=1111947 RepID=A0AAD7TZG3_9APHY|nr:hypothetical protein C8Q70DRAFT_1059043 [Cubamyces menziesii]KAJ8490042.1 hypothetical protein ONZ51_g2549 [Trametes cubensis]